jgi:hypothetical protein|tara:strand:- start:4733 stop:5005 length:273 start_codon:yes stop_codon:yes gene_type:complete
MSTYNTKFKLLDKIIIYILLVYGLIYVALPHSYHIKGFALDWLLERALCRNVTTTVCKFGFEHSTHMFIGSVLLFLGIFYIIFRKRLFIK